MNTLTLVGFGVGTHAIVELQLTLQGVDELSALTQLLLQKGHLMLEPEDTHQHQTETSTIPNKISLDPFGIK